MKLPTLGLGIVVIGSVFVIGPIAMVELNEALAWPRWQSHVGRISGAGLILVGIAIALYCSRLFSVVGAGTPVPTEPPKHLVATGLYRYSRNPIYVADIAILLGLFLQRGELSLLLYAGAFAAVAHWWVVHREEPDLSERFGEKYVRYMQSVPRWVW